jgi:hypothetical protein
VLPSNTQVLFRNREGSQRIFRTRTTKLNVTSNPDHELEARERRSPPQRHLSRHGRPVLQLLPPDQQGLVLVENGQHSVSRVMAGARHRLTRPGGSWGSLGPYVKSLKV